MTTAQRQRFWLKVRRTDGCWIWTAAVDKDGYGTFRFVANGKNHKSHRLAFEDCIGPATGASVLHTCDNPACVNPDHLKLGTQQDNLLDMVLKRRHAYGEKHGGAKLNERDVAQIRSLKAIGVRQVEIARRFNVGDTAISNIVRNKRWRHTAPTQPPSRRLAV